MLDSKEKQTVIYALEEYTKELEKQGNIAWRNEVMELTWKVSAMGEKAYELEGESLDKVLDSIENIIDLHPAPVKQEHCKYCSAWLLIVEDILGNGEGK